MHEMKKNLPPWRDCDKDWKKEFEAYIEENKTLAYMMLKNAKIYKDRTILVQKNIQDQWENISWNEFADRITAVSKSLIEMGIKPGDMCSVFSGNCAEWAVCDMGICATRAVSVPIYATNSIEEAEYIINDAGVKVLFAGDQQQYDKALKIIGNNSYLEYIVAMQDNIAISGDKSFLLTSLIEKGRQLPDEKFNERINSVSPDDMITIIYTSGTTGNPKGAVHTNRSFMNGIFPAWRYPEAGPDSLSMSILPLSHIFERLWSYGCMSAGVKIGYCPDPTAFVEYMGVLKPDFMTSVPRIWDKVYGAIHEGMKNGQRELVLNHTEKKAMG